MPLRQVRPASSRPTVSSQPLASNMNFAFTPPLFNGRDGSFSRFLSDYGTFAQLHSWTEREKLLYLPLCLSGLARDAFEAVDQSRRQSFTAVVEELRLSFAPVGAVEAHTRLQGLKYDSSEPLENFLIKFKAAVRVAFPGGESECLLFTYFLSSLPADLRSQVIAAGCDNFEQAVTKTKCLLTARRVAESPFEMVAGGVQVHRVDDQGPLSQLLSRLEALEAKVDQAISLPQSSVGQGSRGACFACGRSGHTRASCKFGSATCHACGKKGHIRPACRSKNAQPGGRPEYTTTPASSGDQTR